MNYLKPINWNGQSLEGEWITSFKIDGIRAFLTPQGAFSRANKPLANLEDHLPQDGVRDVEVYLDSFANTQSHLMTKEKKTVPASALYDLNPLDPRLIGPRLMNPDAFAVNIVLEQALLEQYEGLVLRQGDVWIKVKPTETYDVKITGFIEGKGKHKNSLGAVMTDMGKVGTGFNDAIRAAIWNRKSSFLGMLIEVECLQLTPTGKFRHARFKRFRLDK